MKTVIDVIETCAQASHAGTMHFGQVVAALAGAGVPAYHADFRARSTTYYLPNDNSHTVALSTPDLPIGDAFDAAAIKAAIAGAQRGEVQYPQFMRLAMAAGCVGYIVWIAGRHVSYFGRRGEVHIEHFPS